MNKIEIRHLGFHYTEGEDILKDISLAFDGRSTAIIGQNGAGKTTFVKLLKGLLKPVRGEVIINGVNTREATVAALARHIGLVFQNPNDQIFKNKVLDEVMFGPLNIGQSEAEARERSFSALAMVGLAERVNDNPYDLSLSERKLISIASIVAMNTEIIIFDEPTIAQDHAGKEHIKAIVRELVGQGKLVLTIIHDMDFVAETFERTLVFAQGAVLLDGSTHEVFAQEDVLRQAHLEAPHVTQLASRMGLPGTVLTVEEFVRVKRGLGTASSVAP
ncbi:MAG: ATP-binding cassette domain-containing protein [Paludibacterium sp.]|uniref:energy-coupling factor ABC transporter ATP-binding protein n=1 Tax=Paludibacterium sp. TaxID=1917523 RepID=UPI0025DE8FCF|nr:ATP-binding cassette domain-containing protein [Paludibacterium sp.]MBV8048613.1 ATP-binding cassette domain-containing protein [Paludibacterium sp.]MBV8648056.1 ATP-binding cassette domain-containing protein [Paludibacterium sp.]